MPVDNVNGRQKGGPELQSLRPGDERVLESMKAENKVYRSKVQLSSVFVDERGSLKGTREARWPEHSVIV